MTRQSFSLTIPSDPRMLSVARSFVEAICQAHRFERSFMHALVIATGEAFSNVVRHAHRDLPAAEIQILLHLESDAVVLSFFDQGLPFNLDQVPNLNPSELRVGGRGIYLLRSIMDELSCQPRPGVQGNHLRMVKRLAS